MQRVIGHVRAVNDVKFTMNRGETLRQVGESGSGKTTIGGSFLCAITPTDGWMKFHAEQNNVDLRALSGKARRRVRRYMA